MSVTYSENKKTMNIRYG